jgi:hypothetical protein
MIFRGIITFFLKGSKYRGHPVYDNQRLSTNEALGELKGTNCMKAKGYCWDLVDSD